LTRRRPSCRQRSGGDSKWASPPPSPQNCQP
ncbi:hypothetical protein EAH_00042010, partial [Eimeria acervulina]